MESQSEMIQEQPAAESKKSRQSQSEKMRNYWRDKKAKEKAAELMQMQKEERERFEINENPQEQQFIHLGKPIKDHEGHVWHIKRRLVPLTPVTCQVKDCGYDLVREFNLPPWDDEGVPYLVDEREMIMGPYGQYVKNPDFGAKRPNPDYKVGMTNEEKSIALKQFAKHVETHKHEQSEIITKSQKEKELWPKPMANRLPVGWK